MLFSPECVSHSQRNLALDHHSVVDTCQQILNVMSKSLLDKPALPQTHDELTGDNNEPLVIHIVVYLRIGTKSLLCTIQQSVKDKQFEFLFI